MRLGMIVSGLLAALTSACSTYQPVYFDRPACPTWAAAPPSAARPEATPAGTSGGTAGLVSAVYDGMTGEPADIETAAAGWGDVDLVAFGEIHGNLEGARHQLLLLQALAKHERPLAVAMEFFERDTQADLDAYLAGTLPKAAFLKQTKRNKAYAATHGPLIEFCKANGIPVIAANAPRRLVTGYRKFDGDYEAYLASLSEADRALLPEETSELDDEYRERFMKLMGPKRGPSFFKSQSLWDDAMAEAIVDFRAEHPQHRVLLIVGGFHVHKGGGTITKYKLRRGKHDVRVVSMDLDKDPALPFRESDRGAGDLILKVRSARR